MSALLAVLLAVNASAQTPPAAPAQDSGPEATVKQLEACVDDFQYFHEDYKKKEAALAKEFDGNIPESFGFLLNMKRGRASRQHEICSRLVKNSEEPLSRAENDIRLLDADKAEYKNRRKELDGLRTRLNATIRRFGSLR